MQIHCNYHDYNHGECWCWKRKNKSLLEVYKVKKIRECIRELARWFSLVCKQLNYAIEWYHRPRPSPRPPRPLLFFFPVTFVASHPTRLSIAPFSKSREMLCQSLQGNVWTNILSWHLSYCCNLSSFFHQLYYHPKKPHLMF